MERVYVTRDLETRLLELSSFFPATVLVGPRQVGKTSLVAALRNQLAKKSLYLDLERPADLAALTNLEAFAEQHLDFLLILDEVQRRPGLFTELRSIIDRHRTPGRFILLGSASFDLIRDASETLAGRIAIEELAGLRLDELGENVDYLTHWLRGGFPDSVLAPSENLSFLWRENLVRTYLERDLPSFGVSADSALMRRVLTMLGHYTGQLLNYQSLAKSLQIDHRTLERYLSLLEQTFVVRRLPAYHVNVGKRLIKTPKVYVRDTGVLHTVLNVSDYLSLSRHPIFGASFESYVLEQLYGYNLHRRTELYYYRTRNGVEMDVVLVRGGQVVAAVEIKTSPAPKLSKGFHSAREDLGNPPTFVICPTDSAPYPLSEGVTVLAPRDLGLVK